ncbi:MAG: hypothetical protein GYA70_00105 [Deltaproteobacteria bacterium]|jgi:hypothetical protein|nr:hypothetical protein [Deltaproteobacteria bacterium]
MANQGNKDGWRTKGNKQLRTKEIVRACQLSKDLDSQGVPHEIVIKCSMPFEMERAADAWAGFIRINNDLRYLGVRVTMI